MTVSIDTLQMEKWITRSEAIATKIENAFVLSQTLYAQSPQAYDGRAKNNCDKYTESLISHMAILWKFHTIRVLYMKQILETQKICDEQIAKQTKATITVNPTLNYCTKVHPDNT